MTEQIQAIKVDTQVPEESIIPTKPEGNKRSLALKAMVLLLIFVAGLSSGYFIGRQTGHTEMSSSNVNKETEMATLVKQVNPPSGYKIPAVFGDIGPQLVAAGAIDVAKFTGVYRSQNQPLNDEEMTILNQESDTNIIITPQNAYFLLNFFWALGLTNENTILTEGPMMSRGKDQVGGFASTGGWTIGTKKPTELYSSTKIMTLTDEQQARLEEVTAGVYRPCCNNPTHFPDCNHGMAMLGLLELMASQNASREQMYEAAKYVNAFWYPQQMLEVATLFKATQKVEFIKADAETVVSKEYSSGSGFQAVHQYLAQNGLLEQAPSSGGSCGVQ